MTKRKNQSSSKKVSKYGHPGRREHMEKMEADAVQRKIYENNKARNNRTKLFLAAGAGIALILFGISLLN